MRTGTNGRRTASERPGVVFQPAVARALCCGTAQVVAAVRPTLGPTPRLVAVAKGTGGAPELLDSAAVIARRIIALPNRDADAGAMLARAVIWRTQQAAGDGAATAAVIFGAALAGGIRYLAAGGDPVALRRHLLRASELVVAGLNAMAEPIAGKERLARLALAVCHDQELAPLLGEIVDVAGAEGQVDVRAGAGRGCDREYLEGMHWPSGVHSAVFTADEPQRRAVVENGAILISDLDLTDAEEVRAVAGQARALGLGGLVVTAQRLSDPAIGALVASGEPPRFRAIAVKTPGTGETARLVALHDLALLTGGQVLSRAAGDRLTAIRPGWLGRARIAWADRDHFGVVGGKGDPRALRHHVRALKAALRDERDEAIAAQRRERLARLLGGSATLWVGGATATELAVRKESATRAAAVLRDALTDGVVPGGGAVFLACRARLAERLAATDDIAERAALRLTMRALEAPTRAIVANAGGDPDAVIARLGERGPGAGYDARTGRIVPLAEAGILDSAAVAKAAVRTALAGAAQALTIDVLVHPRRPEIATTPG